MIYLIFFYSGKAGKGWRKCWQSTILNTTRLLSLQTGARHALSVNTFDILSSFFIISHHQLCQARFRHGKTKWKGKSRKMTETSQDALLIPWTWPTLNSATTSSFGPCCYCCYCSGSHSDGSQTCRGLVTVALSLPVLLMASRGLDILDISYILNILDNAQLWLLLSNFKNANCSIITCLVGCQSLKATLNFPSPYNLLSSYPPPKKDIFPPIPSLFFFSFTKKKIFFSSKYFPLPVLLMDNEYDRI